jgi:hypothetical protein
MAISDQTAARGRGGLETQQIDFEELKRLIHGKLVDKLDLLSAG